MKKYFLFISLSFIAFAKTNAQSCEVKKLLKEKYEFYRDIYTVNTFKTDDNYFIVESFSKEINRDGIVDKYGNEIVPPVYENYFYIGDGKYVVGVNKEQGINDVWDLTTKTKTTLPFKETGFKVSEGLIAFKNDAGLWGFCNLKGEIEIAAAYNMISNEFINGIAIVVNSQEKYALINKKGEILLDFKYDFIQNLTNNLYTVIVGKEEHQQYGIVNVKGNIIVPIQYKMIADRNGLIEVQQQNLLSAFYNYDGKKVTDFIYTANYQSFDKYGYTILEKKGSPLILDTKGKEFRANQYTYIANSSTNTPEFPENIFLYSTKPAKNGPPKTVGLMNLAGKILYKDEFEKIEFIPNRNDLVLLVKTVGSKGVYTIQDLNGKVICSNAFYLPIGTVGNYAFGRNDKGVGAIDLTTGKVVIPFIYDESESVSACDIALIKDEKTIHFDSKLNKL